MGYSTVLSPMDVFAWFLNVSTSVVIVFANKVLLDAKTGHGFVFGEFSKQSGTTIELMWTSDNGFLVGLYAATTLCGLHFLACAASIWAVQALGLADKAPLPWEGKEHQH